MSQNTGTGTCFIESRDFDDKVLAKLYGFTEEEIKIIEDS